MYKLYPYFTNDGSVGLFSPQADDIYHSTYGALTEAYEKFILPINFQKYFEKNNEIKILDICFGIGYNTKSFLNYMIKNICNGSIGSDNILNIDKIYSNNKKIKILIHAVDSDKNLVQISPFIKVAKNNTKNGKLIFQQEKIRKMLATKTISKYKLEKEVNIILLQKLINQINDDINEILNYKEYKKYFDPSIIAYFKFLKFSSCNLGFICGLNSFLHNIYYKYISLSHKKAFKALNLLDLNFTIATTDARLDLINDKNKYNFVFLDAFTPTKCPCLWTIDFIKLIYDHLENNGIVLTYSNSAAVRNAFVNAGFKIKKIYSKSNKKHTGTIAIKSDNEINYLNLDLVHELSEYDLGLLKTKAGIFYRDENLTLPNEAIIALHELEFKNSKLITSSQYKKRFN